MKYYVNDMCKTVSVKGIYILCNAENRSVIGLDEKGFKFWEKIAEGTDVYAGDAEKDELINSLLELDFISPDPYDKSRHNGINIVSAYLHITNYCNLHCLGCYSYDSNRNSGIDPMLEDLKKAMFELDRAQIRNIVISGGEPFLRRDLHDLLSYARSNLSNIRHLSVITNGTIKVDYSLYKGLIDEITVSVDGYSENRPTFIRDKGIFNKIMNTIKDIKKSGIEVSILPTLHSKNYSAVYNYLELSKKLRVPINFSILSACETSALKEYLLKDHQLEVLAESMMNFGVPVNDTPIGISLEAGISCGTGNTVISVAANGNVYPCHMLHFDEFYIGNIFRTPIKDMFYNNSVVERLSDLSVDDIEECRGCSYKYFCGGGCRARSYYKHGDINHKDSYCKLSYHFFDLAIDNILQCINDKKEVERCETKEYVSN